MKRGECAENHLARSETIMKRWRWFLIGAGVITLMWTATRGDITTGLLLADVAAIGWAARLHVIYEPRWTIDDELAVIASWT